MKYDKHDDDRFYDEIDWVMAGATASMVVFGILLVIILL